MAGGGGAGSRGLSCPARPAKVAFKGKGSPLHPPLWGHFSAMGHLCFQISGSVPTVYARGAVASSQ